MRRAGRLLPLHPQQQDRISKALPHVAPFGIESAGFLPPPKLNPDLHGTTEQAAAAGRNQCSKRGLTTEMT